MNILPISNRTKSMLVNSNISTSLSISILNLLDLINNFLSMFSNLPVSLSLWNTVKLKILFSRVIMKLQDLLQSSKPVIINLKAIKTLVMYLNLILKSMMICDFIYYYIHLYILYKNYSNYMIFLF